MSETLEPSRQAEVARHLLVCPSCHRGVEEARLARRVLQDAGAPPPPPRLADRIKAAACIRLSYRPRPLHERALGSPAFLATCASLLCGAIICLLAILQVAYVQPWPQEPPDVTVVETYRLPSRDVTPLAATTVATVVAPARDHVAPQPRPVLAAAPALARALVPAAAPAPPPRPAPAPGRPTRALMAVVRPTPTMGDAPHLPTSTVTLAGVRISRPEALPVAIEPASREGSDRLDLTPAAGPEAPTRGDFTTSRQ